VIVDAAQWFRLDVDAAAKVAESIAVRAGESRGAVMTEAANWRDVKAKTRAAHPTWDSNDRIARRQRMREQMLAGVSGAQLAEIRQQLGPTQVQLAEATGLSQARISQIESGDAVGLDTLRVYIVGLGGHLDIVARIGNIQLNVA
jgi:DNA-binding XRE family transcriptional regulator